MQTPYFAHLIRCDTQMVIATRSQESLSTIQIIVSR